MIYYFTMQIILVLYLYNCQFLDKHSRRSTVFCNVSLMECKMFVYSLTQLRCYFESFERYLDQFLTSLYPYNESCWGTRHCSFYIKHNLPQNTIIFPLFCYEFQALGSILVVLCCHHPRTFTNV